MVVLVVTMVVFCGVGRWESNLEKNCFQHGAEKESVAAKTEENMTKDDRQQ